MGAHPAVYGSRKYTLVRENMAIRISRLSATEEIFNTYAPYYNETLTRYTRKKSSLNLMKPPKYANMHTTKVEYTQKMKDNNEQITKK